MAKQKGKVENLIPQNRRTKEEQRNIATKGGIKSGEVRREKKLVSQILAGYLMKEHTVELRDDDGKLISSEKISADELIERTVTAVLSRGDSASKGMIDSLAAITEGSNINLNATLLTGKLNPAERRARIEALKAKLD